MYESERWLLTNVEKQFTGNRYMKNFRGNEKRQNKERSNHEGETTTQTDRSFKHIM